MCKHYFQSAGVTDDTGMRSGVEERWNGKVMCILKL